MDEQTTEVLRIRCFFRVDGPVPFVFCAELGLNWKQNLAAAEPEANLTASACPHQNRFFKTISLSLSMLKQNIYFTVCVCV